MKFNYLITKIPHLAALTLLFSLASCGSYQYVGHDNDGIYGSENRNVEYQTEDVAQTETSDNNYYKNYFKEKSQELDYMTQNGEIFTDIDSYQGEYDEEVIDSLQYENAYAGWGQNNDDVTINIYNNGWNNWGWNRPWRYNYGWGWNNWGWNAGFGWGWNDPWIWNGGFYGYPYYGYGYGYYGHPYYNNYYYTGIYNRRNYAYNSGRRGSLLNRNTSAVSRRRATNTTRSRTNATTTRPRSTTTRPRTTTPRSTTTTRPRTNSSTPRTTTPRRTTTTPRSSSPRTYSPRSSSSRSSSTRSSSTRSSSRSSSSRGSSMGSGRRH